MQYFIQHPSLQLWAPLNESGHSNMLNLFNSGHSSVYGWASVLDRVKHVSVQEIVCQCNTLSHSAQKQAFTYQHLSTNPYTLLLFYSTLSFLNNYYLLEYHQVCSDLAWLVFWHPLCILYSIKEASLARTEHKYLENNSFPAFEKKDTT